MRRQTWFQLRGFESRSLPSIYGVTDFHGKSGMSFSGLGRHKQRRNVHRVVWKRRFESCHAAPPNTEETK